MTLYLYALVDHLIDVSGLVGIASEPLILVPVGDAVAVGGWITQTPPIEPETLIAQDRTVRSLHARADALLPMRFGTHKADVASVASAVDALGPLIVKRFDLVRSRDQMTLRVLGTTGAAGPPSRPSAASARSRRSAPDSARAEADAAGAAGAGTRYLATRAARVIPPELTPLLAALRPLQRATKIQPGRQSELIGTVYQLIDRGSSDAYRSAAQAAAAKSPALAIRITGPSPAYAFATFT